LARIWDGYGVDRKNPWVKPIIALLGLIIIMCVNQEKHKEEVEWLFIEQYSRYVLLLTAFLARWRVNINNLPVFNVIGCISAILYKTKYKFITQNTNNELRYQ